ncbi:MAG: V4R domain-containing protein [Methanobacteriaceae archaeon]
MVIAKNNENERIPIKIFATGSKGNGFSVIESPIKLRILSMLRESEMEFEDIVKNTGKSKSTISVHLKSLRKEGIISFKLKEEDQRKKIFYINSKYLGEIDSPEPYELEEQKVEFLVSHLVDNGDKFEFTRLLFHTLKTTLIQEGINIDPLVYEAGFKIGSALYDNIKGNNSEEFVKNLSTFWKDNGLGELVIECGDSADDIIQITAFDCFECELLPKKGKPACYLDSGILEAVFTEYMGKRVSVTETKCYAMGDECCFFELEPVKE